MDEENYLKFLGTAGARHVVARQLRYSAGTYLQVGGRSIMIDPGPGTLTRCALARPSIDATGLDAVLLTHAHIDHSNDANILLDAMATGDHEGGELFCPAECLEGETAVILDYARELPKRIQTLHGDTEYRTGNIVFRTSPRHRHGMETYGLMFDLAGTTLSFVPDTEYFPALGDIYAGSDILVVNVVRHYPVKHGHVQHLCADDAAKVIEAVEPKLAILTHFGMTMIRAKPWEVASEMSDKLDIRVEAASDGKEVELSL